RLCRCVQGGLRGCVDSPPRGRLPASGAGFPSRQAVLLTVAGKQWSSAALPLQAITIFPCICPGLDASPPASTHELTIPNDVSKSKCFLSTCVCACVYT
uniref:Uncharacterized protein n=1 Tax=Falco tinnunculus TaxID=100819 RepID=A0A8C4U9Q0_FALTI